MSKQIISFCLFGNKDKYCVGAIRNAELIPKIYPGWVMRVYITQSVPSHIRCELDNFPYVELVYCKEDNWTSMLTRFYPASENDVDVFISRDCDSRLSEREAAAVQEWMNGPKLIHSMGDHPHHFNPSQALMGGMFGMKKHACPQMKDLLEQFCKQYPNAWQCDQDFLRDHVWPLVKHKVLAHSDLHPYCQPFPTQRLGLEFVGKIFLADETTIVEHEQILQKVL